MFRIIPAIALLSATFLPRVAVAEKKPRLTLDQVTRAALHNPLAAAAHHDTEAALARVDEFNGIKWARIKFISFVAPSPEINCVDDCTETSPHDVPINVAGLFVGARLSLTQHITTFGKASAVKSAIKKAAEAKSYTEDTIAGDLTYHAAQAFYGLKLARELIWMLEDGKAEIVKGRKTLQEKLDEGSGEVTIQDRLRIETLEAEVDARLTEAREAEATALAGIRALVGDQGVDIEESPLSAGEFTLDSQAGGYVNKAQLGHPELKAAKAGVAGYDAMARYEKARYRPDLVLIGSVNVAWAQGVDNPPSAFAYDPYNTTSGQVALVLRWKLDPLAQPARVDRARSQARRAASLLEAASQIAEFRVRRAYARAEQSKKRLEVAKKGEKAARGWVASVIQADAVGTASAKDFADAYLAYFTLHGRVLQSAHDWNLAIVGLRRAVGEFTAAKPRH